MKPNQPALVVLTLTALCATLAPSIMIAAPSVSCAAITRYATVTDPRTISFAPDGTLYVGRDNSGSGGGHFDRVKIHRIGPGGSPVVEFGGVASDDPDGVALAAIQGLNQKLEEKETRILALEMELAVLKELVTKISTTRN